MEPSGSTMATNPTVTTTQAWDAQGNPVQQPPAPSVTAWDASGTPVAPASSQQPSTAPQTQSENLIDYDKFGMSLAFEKMLGISTPVAYKNHDLIHDQFKQRGIEIPKSTSSIANDIKSGLESSIFSLAARRKMGDSLPINATKFDKFISGVSEMVADLPFYIAGSYAGAAVGGAAGTVATPGIGTLSGAVVGGGAGAFAVPAVIRESLILGIRKGEIKSFSDLIDRVLDETTHGLVQGTIGAATELSGGATLASKFIGPLASPAVAPLIKKAQQAATLTTLSALSQGHIPTSDDFAVNTALLVAMHTTMAQIDKAWPQAAKVHGRVTDEYIKSGTHPATITAEALTRAQESPNR